MANVIDRRGYASYTRTLEIFEVDIEKGAVR